LCQSSPDGDHPPFNPEDMALKNGIILTRYKWARDKNVSSTGFAFMEGTFVTEKEFLRLIARNITEFHQFASFCKDLNGQFSLVVNTGNEIWLHTGHSWSYPLFYRSEGTDFKVSDQPEHLLPDETTSWQTPPEAASYFHLFGVTPAAFTLERSIKAVRPGETVGINLTSGEIISIKQDLPLETIKGLTPGELAVLLRENFARYAELLKNKQVLLPLTAGYDSRLLACLLKESGHKDVLCATWGREGNHESETARKVAETLGFRYIFVPYTAEVIENFPADTEFQRYAAFAGHLTSMPFLQDYFAIKYLKEQKLIGEETVVMPGHPGDFLRGSHLYASLTSDSPSQVADTIIEAFGNSLPVSSSQKKQIAEMVIKQVFNQEAGIRRNFDLWDFEERQCKFIGNSSQVYHFFSIPCLVPLFDKELLNAMLSLPFNQRLYASLYNQTLESEIFPSHGVGFDLKLKERGWINPSPVKKLIIRYAPRIVRRWYYPMKDNIFYREITEELIKSLPARYKHPLKPHYYNGYLVQWYLNWIKPGFQSGSQIQPGGV
jgi:asparagine synthase (glutamine-hydrolysing)